MRGYIPPRTNEEQVFVKKITRILELADGLGRVQFTLFMDLRQQELFNAQANKYPGVNTCMWYGYDGEGERALSVCCPEYMDAEYVEVPAVVLKARLNDDNLSHKDFLGAAMSLKIDREYMGDIIIKDGFVYMICHKNVADIIKDELTGVKRSSVSFDICDEPLQFTKQYSEERTTTGETLELDEEAGTAVLTGSPARSVKGNDVLEGGRLLYYLDSDDVVVIGNVEGELEIDLE